MKWLGIGGSAIDVIYSKNGRDPIFRPGGSLPNVGRILSMLGNDSSLITTLGDDMEGKYFKQEVNKNKMIVHDEKIKTTGRFIQRIDDPEKGSDHNYYLKCSHGVELPKIQNPSLKFVKKIKIDVPQIYNFQILTDSTFYMAKKLYKAGSTVWFEPQKLLKEHEKVLPYCHIVKYSRDSNIKTNCWLVIQTMGADGTRYKINDSDWKHVEPIKINVLDAGGAGDHFSAGVIDSLYRRNNIKTSLENGTALAALSCMYAGAFGLGDYMAGEAKSIVGEIMKTKRIPVLKKPNIVKSDVRFKICNCK